MEKRFKEGVLFVTGALAQKVLDRIFDWSEVVVHNVLPIPLLSFSDWLLIIGLVIGVFLIYSARTSGINKLEKGLIEIINKAPSSISLRERAAKYSLLETDAESRFGAEVNHEEFYLNPDLIESYGDASARITDLATKVLKKIKALKMKTKNQGDANTNSRIQIALIYPRNYDKKNPRGYPNLPDRRLMLNFDKHIACDSPPNDADLIEKKIVSPQNYTFRWFHLDNLRLFALFHGLWYKRGYVNQGYPMNGDNGK